MQLYMLSFVRTVVPLLYEHQFCSRPSWSWSYGSWINNSLCNQCLSLLKLWVQTPSWWGVLDTTLCDKVCQVLATGRWFSPRYISFLHQ